MNRITTLLLLLMSCYLSNAQTIKGSLIDSNSLQGVRLATVSLIQESDSSLINYTRTDYDGNYTLRAPHSGVYLILYGHPSFVDYVDKLIVGTEDIDLGDKLILTRIHMLREVIVRQKGNVFIKGDTLEYLTDSVKLDETANVEDLLKALPGMQVDKDGNITAQGEKVEKVLVDGEEFFGNDPTMVTRNLNANIVDKVQVYEKKSEEAEFTGIDDGNNEKTIDIKLKKDMNKGTFGKISLHGGTDNIWDNAVMANSFKGKRKISFYGIASSNGEAGINWGDMKKYGLNNVSQVYTDDGRISQYDNDIQYNGQGRPRNWTLGTYYANKWNDKHELNISANYRKMDLFQNDSSISYNYISEDAYANDRKSNSYGRKGQLYGNLEYDWHIDSLTDFGLDVNGSIYQGFKDLDENLRNILLGSSDILSSTATQLEAQDSTDSYNLRTFIKRKLGKPGRTISLYYNRNEEKTNFGQNKNLNIFYGADQNNSAQKVQGLSKTATNGGDITYTEPLYKESWVLELKESYQKTSSVSDYATRAADAGTENYLDIDSLSNDFVFNQEIFTTSAGVQFHNKKLNTNANMGVGIANFERIDHLRPMNSQKYQRTNLFPSLRMRYSFNQFMQLRFSYSGNTNQPTLTELQPTYDFSDPINIKIGNPQLNQEYNQRVQTNFWTYDAFKERSIWVGFVYSNTIDRIASITYFDPGLGRSVTTYTNLNGYSNVSQWAGYYKKWNEKNISINLGLNSNYNKFPFVTNGVTGTSNTFSLSPRLGMDYSLERKISTGIHFKATHVNTKSSVEGMSNNYWTFNPDWDMTYRPIDILKIKMDVEYLFREKRPPFVTDFHRTLWNGSVSVYPDKEKRIELKLTAHDILNQNRGYDRTSYSYIVRENTYNTIARYFMIGATYNFAIGPMAAKQNGGLDEDEEQW